MTTERVKHVGHFSFIHPNLSAHHLDNLLLPSFWFPKVPF